MNKEVVIENDQGEIWRCGKFFMIYLNNSKLNAKVSAWKSALFFEQYIYPDGRRHKQYRIPKQKLDNAIKILSNSKKDPITEHKLTPIFEHCEIQYNLL